MYTDWSTGCIRNLLFKSYGLQDQLKTETSERGARNEERFEATLREKGVDFVRELNSPVNSVTDNVAWGGRSDVLRCKAGGAVEAIQRGDQLGVSGDAKKSVYDYIWELKSTGSKNKLRDLRAGKYTTENLAQTVAYMLDFEVPQGSLLYTYYAPDKEGKDEVKYEREFKVVLDDLGRVVVDKEPTIFLATDQLEHRLRAAEAIDQDIVWDRPHNYAANWGSPCHFCPFKTACDKWDNKEIQQVGGLLEEASKCLGVK